MGKKEKKQINEGKKEARKEGSGKKEKEMYCKQFLHKITGQCTNNNSSSKNDIICLNRDH